MELPVTFGDECFSPSSKMAAAKEPVALSDKFLACVRANREETTRKTEAQAGEHEIESDSPLQKSTHVLSTKSLGFEILKLA